MLGMLCQKVPSYTAFLQLPLTQLTQLLFHITVLKYLKAAIRLLLLVFFNPNIVRHSLVLFGLHSYINSILATSPLQVLETQQWEKRSRAHQGVNIQQRRQTLSKQFQTQTHTHTPTMYLNFDNCYEINIKGMVRNYGKVPSHVNERKLPERKLRGRSDSP